VTSVGDDVTSRNRFWTGRRFWMIVGLVVLVFVTAAVYLAYLAMQVKDELESAKTSASATREAMLDGNVEAATTSANAAAAEVSSAKSRTHNPVWTVAAVIPWLGDPLDSVREMTDAVSDLANDVLIPTAELSDILNPDSLRSGDTGINVVALADARAKLGPIADSAEQVDAAIARVDGTWLTQVSDAQTQLLDQTTSTARFIRGVDVATQLLPPMLGMNEDRAYFLGFQTPSEARATGGLMGAFGIVTAEDGVVDVPDLGRNSDLRPPKKLPDFGEDFNILHGSNKPYEDTRTSNISAHFPYAAQIWMNMWQQQTGQKLDGAIAIDPIALSYLLRGTGPITLPDGEVITADNVVPITLSTSYERFGTENAARKAYLQQIASSAVDSVASSDGDAATILEGLGRGVHEGRIMIYSDRPEEQALLETTNLAHEIPETTAPYLNVVVQNAAGNKIDYYLEREISYAAGDCSGDTRTSTATVKLTNTLTDPAGLPPYVVGHLGNVKEVPPGTSIAVVQVVGTQGGTIDSATLDGDSMFFSGGAERGHPASFSQIVIPPGKTVTVEYTMTEPTSAGEAVVPVQPLVDEPVVTVDVPVCG
jgi:hypothetical protein